ncbi:MAG: 2-amino-4-hydroxy-6-hydroxymethyldihydropteridine diphosphokinase [Candidatus Binatia bacterium]|nr:2-amino-4-hydroxy-6-hydroxymethyldihydropteridine diphosphokinase [Candidatus Binatia bacterium]
MPHQVFIAIGSNLGDRKANHLEAIRRIQELPHTRVVKQSSFYESEPHGDATEWFVNSVIEVQTDLTPEELLRKLQAIEEEMGRKRVKGKKGDNRVIDLDILFYESLVLNKRNLKIPHPEIPNRKFVLLPLSELAPSFRHPELHKSVSELLATTKDTKRVHLYRGS